MADLAGAHIRARLDSHSDGRRQSLTYPVLAKQLERSATAGAVIAWASTRMTSSTCSPRSGSEACEKKSQDHDELDLG